MEFLQLCGTFLKLCASLFNVPFPGLDISIFQVFAGFLIIGLVLKAIAIIFGISLDSDKEERKRERYHHKH